MIRRPPVSIALVALVVGIGPHAGAAPADRGQSATSGDIQDSQVISCGPLSLYTLCRLEGARVDLATVCARLPHRPASGHSMAELRDEAAACGLRLRGVHLGRGDWPLDRPALIHLDRESKGHFAVIRPVGHSGRLVQVIDALHEVEVLDFDRLVASPSWTGLALVPSRPDWAARGAGVLALGASIAGLVRVGPRLGRRGGRDGASPVSIPEGKSA